MVFRGRGVVQRHVVRRVMVPGVVVVVVRIRVVVVVLRRLRRLPLRILLVLHSSILEPYFYLPLRQVEVSRQLPPLLFRHVGVEQELFFQLQRLEFRVRLALFAHRYLASPVERVRRPAADPHSDRHRQGTCAK